MLIHYPTRCRPQMFKRTLELYLRDPIARVLVTVDLDDGTMNTDAMREWLRVQDRVTVRWGECKSKVEAVNDGLDEVEWDGVCLIASDDMLPQRMDYASRILDIFNHFFPDGDGVLHLNDGRVGRDLNTLPIFDRKYFDRFGYCYCPKYMSVFVDNEFHEVSERLGRAVYVPEVIIKHEWIGGTSPNDPLNRYNESFHAVDAATFQRRKAAGFP